MIVALVLVAFGLQSVVLAVVDARTHRLPDALVLPGYGLAAVLLVTAAASGDAERAGRTAVSAALFFTCALTLHVIRPGGLGGGDVKLSGVVGAFAGWAGEGAVATTVLALALLSGFAAVVTLAAGTRANRRGQRATTFAFGPVLLGGVWCALAASVV